MSENTTPAGKPCRNLAMAYADAWPRSCPSCGLAGKCTQMTQAGLDAAKQARPNYASIFIPVAGEGAAAPSVEPQMQVESSPVPPDETERLLEHGVRAAIAQFGADRFARALCTHPTPAAREGVPPESKPLLDTLVDRFLSWPLPRSVRPDACAMDADSPHRSGTNLLTASEARAMFAHVLAASPAAPAGAPAGVSDALIDRVTTTVFGLAYREHPNLMAMQRRFARTLLSAGAPASQPEGGERG